VLWQREREPEPIALLYDRLHCVLKVNVWVIARLNSIVCLNNVPDSPGDEVVEGVDVLLDEPSDLEECWEERELVDGGGDRGGQRAIGRWRQLLFGRVVRGGHRHGGGGGQV